MIFMRGFHRLCSVKHFDDFNPSGAASLSLGIFEKVGFHFTALWFMLSCLCMASILNLVKPSTLLPCYCY
ncbi:hypothetical protein J5N97_008962 [Dioscorea zingiberensis]|uniref:Uncharacterized protein n=1 Tax=Dioscorea zingiberensis TaxID=325984 RepID=A0A9D5CXC2_9LILI|nr:hypothetical protein J5N97_008962 [Dioscorea zingiberensis]